MKTSAAKARCLLESPAASMQHGHLTGKVGVSSSLRRLGNSSEPSLLKFKAGWGATSPTKKSSSCTMPGGGTTGLAQHFEVWACPAHPNRSEVGQQVQHCSAPLLPQDTEWMGTWLQHPFPGAGMNGLLLLPAVAGKEMDTCWACKHRDLLGGGSGAAVGQDRTGQQGWLCRELSSFR